MGVLPFDGEIKMYIKMYIY